MQEQQEALTVKITDTVNELAGMLPPIREQKINVVPYEGSWTAGQLFSHVTKSIEGMATAMNTPGKPAEREPGQRIEELKKIFLDFSHKLNAPEFIVPGPGPYDKETTLRQLAEARQRLIDNASRADMTELVTGLPLGPITKWEIYHFVLFHTQRHIHQMKKIAEALN